jgi:hypothetical protein
MTAELEPESAALPPSEDRHSRKCTICNHPERESIDEDFLHWSRGERIVRDYNLPSLSSLYRHAHACGLWNLRRIKIRCALDRLIERAADCNPSGNAVLRAIEMSCRFDQDDRYIEPNKRVIIEHHTIAPEPNADRKSNQPTPHVTPTKQTKAGRVRAVDRLCDHEETDSARQERVRADDRLCDHEETDSARQERVRAVDRLCDHEETDSARQERVRADDSARQEIDSNRESLRLENDVTPTKQRPDPDSNREVEALLSAPQSTALGAAIQNMLIGISQGK